MQTTTIGYVREIEARIWQQCDLFGAEDLWLKEALPALKEVYEAIMNEQNCSRKELEKLPDNTPLGEDAISAFVNFMEIVAYG